MQEMHLHLRGRAMKQPQSEQHGRGNIHQETGRALKGFPDPERDRQVEGQYSIVESAAKQNSAGRGPLMVRNGDSKPSLYGEINQERQRADYGPADVVRDRNSEV